MPLKLGLTSKGDITDNLEKVKLDLDGRRTMYSRDKGAGYTLYRIDESGAELPFPVTCQALPLKVHEALIGAAIRSYGSRGIRHK